MSRSNDAPGRNLSSPPDPPDGGGRGWILPLVVAVLVVAVFVLIGVAKRAEKPEAASPSAPPAPAAPAQPAPPPVVIHPPVPPAVTKGTNAGSTNPVAPLKLQGIVFDAAEPGAIVDGKTLHVGDRIRGCRVQEITPGTVTLEDTNGTTRTLFLGK